MSKPGGSGGSARQAGGAAANRRLQAQARSSVENQLTRPPAHAPVLHKHRPHLHARPHVAQRLHAYVQAALGPIDVHAVGAAVTDGAHRLRPGSGSGVLGIRWQSQQQSRRQHTAPRREASIHAGRR